MIFPYILQALTADILHERYDLDRLTRISRRRESRPGRRTFRTPNSNR
jgi:hypothetical protein